MKLIPDQFIKLSISNQFTKELTELGLKGIQHLDKMLNNLKNCSIMDKNEYIMVRNLQHVQTISFKIVLVHFLTKKVLNSTLFPK